MEIKINKEELMKGVQSAIRAVPNKTTLPILECVLITAENDEIRVTGNDTQLGIEAYLDGEITENGKIAIDAKMFAPVIQKLPDGMISLKTDGEEVAVKSGRTKFVLNYRDGDEFPYLDNVSRDRSITISCDTLKDAIRQTVFSTSMDSNNKMMTGELFEVNGNKMRIVALDGHRVATREIELDKEYGPIKVIIPGKALSEIFKIASDGDVAIFIDKMEAAFSFGSTLVTTRLIEGDYFNVDAMMAQGHTTSITVNRKELLDCADRSQLFIRETDRKPVIVTIDETMKIDIKSHLGSMSEEIEIEKDGEGLVIGLNPRFLTDVLKVLDEEKLTIDFKDKKSPCFIRGEGYAYMILPINFNGAT